MSQPVDDLALYVATLEMRVEVARRRALWFRNLWWATMFACGAIWAWCW